MSFKTELHCHTSEFSWCSNQGGADVAKKYIENGYNTVVVTNHFCHYYPEHKEFESFTRKFFEAAEIMREAAGDKLNVLTGMELTLECMPNDFLLYGVTEEFLLEIGGEIFELEPRQVRDRVHEVGGIIVQAHPFRFGQTVVNPDDLDGIEVFNGHPGQRSHNEVTKHWALYWMEHHRRDGSYILTSGSDHHYDWQQPNAGIETEEEITSMDQLLAVLKSGKFTRITASLGENDY